MSKKAKICRSCDVVRRKEEGALGMSGATVHKRWRDLNYRCNTSSAQNYEYYGGRGIKICERWKEFKNFYADMGDVPFKGAQLDRINPDGDYSPENCRWVGSIDNWGNRRISKENRSKYKIVHVDKLCSECKKQVDGK